MTMLTYLSRRKMLYHLLVYRRVWTGERYSGVCARNFFIVILPMVLGSQPGVDEYNVCTNGFPSAYLPVLLTGRLRNHTESSCCFQYIVGHRFQAGLFVPPGSPLSLAGPARNGRAISKSRFAVSRHALCAGREPALYIRDSLGAHVPRLIQRLADRSGLFT